MKRLSLVLLAVFALALCGFSQEKEAAKKKASKPAAAHKMSGGPDVAHLQKIWDAWATMDPKNCAPFYAQGPDHTFFDVAPLKYNSWDEYQAGVLPFFKDLKSLKLTVNDDAKIHGEGNWAWATATVKEEATTKSGKHEMSTFRWTAVFEKSGDKWLTVHEHVSEPRP